MSAGLQAPESQQFILSNGLKVVLVAAGSAPVATVAVLYRVGSRNEAVGHTGAAHLLEHMLFKGTEQNNPRQGHGFWEAMLEIGANANANTWLDRTLYFETLPVAHLSFALELEADRMLRSLIAPEAHQAEVTVVRNELEQRSANPRIMLEAALYSVAYIEHPYHHPTIGWRTDVENMSTEQLRDFYRTFYRPDNATLFVTGGIDIDATASAVCAHFGNLEKFASPVPEVHTSEPPQIGERSLTIRWPASTKMLMWACHIPNALGYRYVLSNAQLRNATAAAGALSGSCALEVLENVLSAGTSSRLRRRLVDAGLAYDVWAGNGIYRDPALFVIGAAVHPDISIEAVSEAISEEINAIVERGVTEAEVLEAKSSLAANRVHYEENVENLAFELAEWEARGGWELHKTYHDVLQSVTPDGVLEAAKAYFHQDNRTVARLEPGAPPIFAIPVADIAVSWQGALAVPRPAIPRASRSSLPSFASEICGGSLAENVWWNFVRRDVAPTVHVRGLLQVDGTFSGAHTERTIMTARMLARGTKLRGRAAIDAQLRERGTFRTYHIDRSGGDPFAFRIRATALSSSLEWLLNLLAEELSEPKFAPEDFELVRAQRMSEVSAAQTETAARARQRLLELLFRPENPHYESPVEQRIADLQRMTIDDVTLCHRDLLSRGRFILSVAGDAAAPAVERMLSTLVSHMPQRGVRHPDVVATQSAAVRQQSFVELERKPNADILIGRAVGLTRKSPNYDAAVLANQVLGGHSIESRLGRRLRGQEGLTYGASSALCGIGLIPGFWNAGTSTNPVNTTMAIQSALAVLEQYATVGPTEREITAAKNATIGSTLVELRNNGGIAGMLEATEYFSLGRSYVDNLADEIESVSSEDIRRLGFEIFNPNALSIVVAGSKPTDGVS